MEAEEKPEAKPKKRTRTRILKLALAIVVILSLLLVFLMPELVSSEKGRKTILAKINNSIDTRTDFSGLTEYSSSERPSENRPSFYNRQ